ncbi:hypothetical protein FACHB389_35510 [Nostoc calcicola FACHB-389]|nr:hypothetical protein [Nostoc calcicola FACHB-3891]OKH15944.1 hypothetical protein FACHB389_35510 [Nostoc calcicola FACHB-389]
MKIPDFPVLETLASNDLLFGWNAATGTTRSIPVSTVTSANQARLINSNATASKIDTLIVDNRSGNITVTVPVIQPGEVGIINITCISNAYRVYLNFSGEKFKGFTTVSNPYIQSAYKSTELIYLDSSNGWIEIDNNLVTYLAPYRTGMRLWLEGGSLLDKSGNGNNATAVTSGSTPAVVVGIDNRQVLRWAGSGTQELQISPFLSGTTGATLYCVFTVNANTNYNLIRTANLDDYWRLASNGNGYIGTFLSARRTDYPASMPSSGHHLVSIHTNSTTYEVLLDNLSKSSVSVAYSPGDRFRIGTNDKAFNGDIAALLVYPYYSKTSTEHLDIVNTIKNNYPSLTLV